jgi:hypothetical protein
VWGDGSREGGGEIGRCGEGRWSGDRGGVGREEVGRGKVGRGEAGRREIRRARGIVLVLQVHSAPLKNVLTIFPPLAFLAPNQLEVQRK